MGSISIKAGEPGILVYTPLRALSLSVDQPAKLIGIAARLNDYFYCGIFDEQKIIVLSGFTEENISSILCLQRNLVFKTKHVFFSDNKYIIRLTYSRYFKFFKIVLNIICLYKNVFFLKKHD